MKRKKSVLKREFWLNPKRGKANSSSKSLTYNGEKIPMIKFVKNEIKETSDLSIFKKCRYNRDEPQGGYKQLLNSVLNHGWILPLVIVNKNMEVLYGQNTLSVAREINGSVYYAISEDQSPSQLVAKESGRRWSAIEALKTYASDPTNFVAQHVLKIYTEIGMAFDRKENKGKYRKVTVPQLLAVLYRDPTYVYGLRARGGIDVLGNLKSWDSKDENSIRIAEILGFTQKHCLPKGAKSYPMLTGLLKFIFDNEKTIDFQRLRDKLKLFEFHGDDELGYYKQVENIYT